MDQTTTYTRNHNDIKVHKFDKEMKVVHCLTIYFDEKRNHKIQSKCVM